MPPHHPAEETLRALRRRVGAIAQGPTHPASDTLALGVPTLDRALGGGLALGALHEIAPAAPLHFGAAAFFALAVLARLIMADDRAALWSEPEAAEFEAGHLYGPGLEIIGLPMARLIAFSAPHERDGVWAMEETLRCCGVAAVVGELTRENSALDLTTLRRLSLAAGEGSGVGILLRHRACALPSPAVTRCEIAGVPGARDRFGGLGRPAILLSLVRNRRGPTGRWLLSWDRHEHAFHSAPLSLDLAAAASDRPPRAAGVRAG
jgi:protein ImuA